MAMNYRPHFGPTVTNVYEQAAEAVSDFAEALMKNGSFGVDTERQILIAAVPSIVQKVLYGELTTAYTGWISSTNEEKS